MTRLTDKELIEAADKGLMSRLAQKKAIKAYYLHVLPESKSIGDAVNVTARKFDVSIATVRNVVAQKY